MKKPNQNLKKVNVKNNKKPKTNSVRINKYLADIGLATRKQADILIKSGLVLINNKKAVLGDKIYPSDVVTLKEDINSKEEFVYYAYYKKMGVSTNKNPGEENIIEVTEFPKKVFPVGRLDKDSEGLIIMTNDGRITNRLLSPNYKHEKEYRVIVNKPITDMFLRRLRDGVAISKKEKTAKAKAKRIDSETLDIAITEGKNRQIRRMCSAFGYGVKRLKRFRIMNINIGNLKPGTYRNIEGKELKEFLKMLEL